MKEKRQNRKKRRILLTIIMILFIGIVLTASTYAWFTANKSVTVNSLDVNVAAQNGLQISVDATTWKTIISREDLEATLAGGTNTNYPTNINMLPFRQGSTSIVPTSTTGDIQDGKFKMYTGTIVAEDGTGVQKLTSTVSNAETKGNTGEFVAFDLFFQVDAESQIYLGQNSAVTDADTTNILDDGKGLQYASRVGWIVEGNVAKGSTKETAQALQATSASATNVKVWEPNADGHTPSGLANARDNYGLNSLGASTPYKALKAAINAPGVDLTATDADKFGDVIGLLSTPKGQLTADTQWFTLKAGITKVRFYLWVEGQDVDCENNASGANLNYLMNFYIK